MGGRTINPSQILNGEQPLNYGQSRRGAQAVDGGTQDAAKQDAALVGGTEPASSPSAKPTRRERRAQKRHDVDTSAVIYLVRAGSRLGGRIQDLSASGCRIRTSEPFPVGIYTRVETEFHVEGLPFRLAGVVQSIHDQGRVMVGIRFLDMSERKREQLAVLIEEIDELAARKAGAQAAGPGD